MRVMLPLMLVNMLTVALASPKLPSPAVRRAITNAVRAGSATELAAVLDKYGLHASSVIAAQGDTLLHDAVVEGSLEVVEYLLEHNAEVNATNQYGNTPLDEAQVFAVDREIVALLEQAGATHGEILISFHYLMETYHTLVEIRVDDVLGDDTSMGNFTRPTLLGLGD